MGEKYDVIVIGLGTMGSMALWQLAQAGLRVLGVEQHGIGHAHGAFAGESRLFRVATHENAVYTPMLLRARDLWRELEEATGRQLLLETGVLSIAEEGSETLTNVLGAVQEHRLPHRVLNAEQLRREYPQHRVGERDVGIYDGLAGALRPEASVLAAVALAQRQGAKVLSSAQVTSVEVADDVVVTAAGQQITAEKAVLTPGSWARELLPELGKKFRVKPTPLAWFLPERHADFTPEVFPAFIRDAGDVHLFGAPSVDGYTVKIVQTGMSEPVWSMEDMDLELLPETLAEMGRNVNALVAGVSPEPVRWSVHPEGITGNKVPILDTSYEGRLITLAGFSGHGFKFAPVIGEIAFHLATGQGLGYDDPGFRLTDHPDIT